MGMNVLNLLFAFSLQEKMQESTRDRINTIIEQGIQNLGFATGICIKKFNELKRKILERFSEYRNAPIKREELGEDKIDAKQFAEVMKNIVNSLDNDEITNVEKLKEEIENKAVENEEENKKEEL